MVELIIAAVLVKVMVLSSLPSPSLWFPPPIPCFPFPPSALNNVSVVLTLALLVLVLVLVVMLMTSGSVADGGDVDDVVAML